MKRRPTIVLCISAMLAASVAVAKQPPAEWLAVHGDETQRATAAAELRRRGPAGLEALFAAHPLLVQTSSFPALDADLLARFRQAVKAVAMQKDAHASRLFWYTDLDEAREAARESGRPILSLRLLGTLDADLSCANSRFFRTTLYADPRIAELLRERFVLHWESVRPVPVVTIDFGDGRVLQRTITGNSIHYAVDAEGRIIDGLPGLYTPAAFLEWLDRTATIAEAQRDQPPAQRREMLASYHRTRLVKLEELWREKVMLASAQARSDQPIPAPPDADNMLWTRIAAMHWPDAQLHPAAVELLRQKHPAAQDAARLAVSKAFVEDPLLRAIALLQRNIALDTVRNEHLLHVEIHQWLADDPEAMSLGAFNERVYDELFLTPAADPWLGLAADDAINAIDNGGVVASN